MNKVHPTLQAMISAQQSTQKHEAKTNAPNMFILQTVIAAQASINPHVEPSKSRRQLHLFDSSLLQFEDEQPEFDATISDELKERCFLFF